MGGAHEIYDPLTISYLGEDKTEQFIIDFYSKFSTAVYINNKITSSVFSSYLYTTGNTNVANLFNQSVTALSVSYPRFCCSEYIHVVTSADSNTWDDKGVKKSILEILPRNRAYQSIVSKSEADIFQSTPWIKTKLSSLRILKLKLEDEFQNPIFCSKDYIIKLAIKFL